MEDHPNSGDTQSTPGNLPRRSSDVLSDRLAQVRMLAGQTERQRELSAVRNLDLRDQIEALRKHVERRQEEGLASQDAQLSSQDANVQRIELDTLRRELDTMRQQLSAAQQANASSREVELEAELQAERQQAALLRKAIQEKEHALDDLATQCQSLEDVLEDRNREMDHLNRQIEHTTTALPQPDAEPSAAPTDQVTALDSLHSLHGQDSDEILDVNHLPMLLRRRPRWKRIGIVGSSLLTLGLIGLLAVFLLMRHPDSTSSLSQGAQTPAAGLASSGLQGEGAAVKASAPLAMEPTTASEQPPLPRLVRDRLRSGGEGPLLIQLPAGRFIMGSKPGLTGLEEQPAREVVLKAFAIGRFETTFDEYARFARARGRPLPDDAGFGRGNRPVINVSWEDAQAYVRWLSLETSQHYRLPSEAEWEYAARGGSKTRYWWGFAPKTRQAICFVCGTRWDNRSTAPVGSLAANAFGLYDTSGNVMEWVQDCFHRNYDGAPRDGSPWLKGDCSQRMVRGGAFNKPVSSARSTARFQLPVDARFNMLGFRVVRD